MSMSMIPMGAGGQVDPVMLAALMERMRVAEALGQPGMMAGMAGGSMGMGGMGGAASGAAGGAGMAGMMGGMGGPIAAGVGATLETIGNSIAAKKDRKLQKDALKEQKRSNTIQQGASNAQLLQNLIRIMGGGGLYGR